MDLLAIHWSVDPVLIHLGSFGIRWYSLLFVSGFIIGWYLFRWFFRREGISEKLLDPLLYTLLIATIVGARLGHCIFYQPEYYFGTWKGFLEVFQPWKGGLASHGGAIALILGMWWFSAHYGKKNDFDFMWILDHLVITVAFAPHTGLYPALALRQEAGQTAQRFLFRNVPAVLLRSQVPDRVRQGRKHRFQLPRTQHRPGALNPLHPAWHRGADMVRNKKEAGRGSSSRTGS